MFSKRVRADLALLFCALIWGATFVLVKDALSDVSVFAYLAVRFALAAGVMGILFWRSLAKLNGPALWAGMQIGLFMLGGYAFQTTGLKFTTPAKSAFITGSSVVVVPILLAVFSRRRIAPWVWAGAVSALGGLYLLMIPREGFGGLNRGDVISLGCAVMFALHCIFIGRYVRHHSVGALSFLQVATTAVFSALLLPLLGATSWEPPRWHWSATLIFAVLITSLGSTVIGFSFQTWAQQYTSPSHTAIFISLEPVFAVLTSWLFAREHLGPRILLGAALILAGILLAELKGPSPVAPESPEPIVSPGVGEVSE
ncbi:MAG TPA: DMT family transporter [Candidatus Limnocylindrales bacterium]|nr:DMT family transporter [Candidatus Limnocylindrales bacterium]